MIAANTITKSNLYASMSEAELQRRIATMAAQYGWLYFHDADSRKNSVKIGDVKLGKGFLDTVLCKPPRFLIVECKREKGQLTKEQWIWLQALRDSGIDAQIWRPSYLPDIEEILKMEVK